jgi:tRNA(adenine34) deaminase
MGITAVTTAVIDNSERDSLDLFWMQHALQLADRAAALGEVPIGAVLIKDEQIIGEGWNSPISSHDPTAHAEIMAVRVAAHKLGNYRLLDTTLYVTVEPCVMCAGALVHARIKEVVFGASEPKTGAVSSAFSVLTAPQHNHQIVVRGGVLASEAAERLQVFFRSRR